MLLARVCQSEHKKFRAAESGSATPRLSGRCGLHRPNWWLRKRGAWIFKNNNCRESVLVGVKLFQIRSRLACSELAAEQHEGDHDVQKVGGDHAADHSLESEVAGGGDASQHR